MLFFIIFTVPIDNNVLRERVFYLTKQKKKKYVSRVNFVYNYINH